MPLRHDGREAVGLGVLRFSVNDIPTTGNFRYDDVGPDGLPGTHDPGEGNHAWDPGEPVLVDPSAVVWRSDVEWALLAGYARPVGPHGSAGLSAKFLRQRLADRQSNGFGVDAGFRAELGAGMEMAARVSDLTSTRVTWSTGAHESVGPTLEVGFTRLMALGGGANTMRLLIGAASARAALDAGGHVWHGGLEYGYRDRLFLRAGSSSGEASFGAGLGLKKFRVDYATVPFHELGSAHRLSALVRW